MIDADSLEGMVSAAEFAFLGDHAASVENGCIVEVGSWRGKSAIALALGAARSKAPQPPMVYCVEPHANAVGVYGGRFGPADRKAFYRAMLDADMAERIALVNLSSAEAAIGFKKPIGLIFIDGDHTEAGVEADVKGWLPHLAAGGLVLFDDALDENIGPAKVIKRLLATGDYDHVGEVGKIVAIRRKLSVGPLLPGPDRELNVAHVRKAVVADGYDENFGVWRLLYGTFASPGGKYLYVETAKAACTSIKHLMLELDGVRFDPRLTRPYFRETRMDMTVHQRALLPVPTVLDLPQNELRDALSGAAGWFTFGVCRNPYSRLVSVYENKVRQREPGYQDQLSRFAGDAYADDLRVGFAAYVAGIRDDMMTSSDAHLMPQSDLLLVRTINYTKIFHVEQLAQLGEALSKHLDGRPIAFGRFNSSRYDDWRSYYTPETARIVAELYAADFTQLGYEIDSWTSGPDEPIVVGRLERALLEEIQARNEMIDFLYDIILGP